MSDSYATSVPGFVFRHASLSDIGCKRPKNEDAVGFFTSREAPGLFLLIVADGVGGSVAGEIASQLAVDSVARHVFRNGPPADHADALRDALFHANRVILDEAARDPSRTGMATTCTAALVSGWNLVIGHVGDCRLYIARGDDLIQITHDHSLAADCERRGCSLSPEQEVLSNVLTRWLGSDCEPVVDIERQELAENDGLVLCSDGLLKMVRDEEILAVVSEQEPGDACRRLVELARQRGGPDNITVQVGRIHRE